MRTPLAATQAPMRTIRTRDLGGPFPAQQAARLIEAGKLRRLAHGYLVAVPDDRGPDWRPTIETAAAGIAAAIFGQRNMVLMGVTAARLHHVIPRAIGVAVVAAPRQHRPVELAGGGTVLFVKRNPQLLDAELTRLELGQALVTTPEQTLLDLIRRPTLGGIEREAQTAIDALTATVDMNRVQDLANQQRAQGAMRALRQRLQSAP